MLSSLLPPTIPESVGLIKHVCDGLSEMVEPALVNLVRVLVVPVEERLEPHAHTRRRAHVEDADVHTVGIRVMCKHLTTQPFLPPGCIKGVGYRISETVRTQKVPQRGFYCLKTTLAPELSDSDLVSSLPSIHTAADAENQKERMNPED